MLGQVVVDPKPQRLDRRVLRAVPGDQNDRDIEAPLLAQFLDQLQGSDAGQPVIEHQHIETCRTALFGPHRQTCQDLFAAADHFHPDVAGVLGKVAAGEVDIHVVRFRVEQAQGAGSAPQSLPGVGIGGPEHPGQIAGQLWSLDQIIVRPRLERGHSGLLIAGAGEDHQRQRPLALPAVADQLQPAAVRKVQVGEYHVEEAPAAPGQELQGSSEGPCDLQNDIRSNPGEFPADQVGVDRVILDIEHAQCNRRRSHTIPPQKRPLSAAAGW